jgi:hypothetical protein
MTKTMQPSAAVLRILLCNCGGTPIATEDGWKCSACGIPLG